MLTFIQFDSNCTGEYRALAVNLFEISFTTECESNLNLNYAYCYVPIGKTDQTTKFLYPMICYREGKIRDKTNIQ